MDKKILLVDDEANVLQGYHRVLNRTLALELAQGGTEALDLMERQGPFAVVVADMQMPGMTGLEFLARVKARYPDTTRLMLTGNSDQKTAMDAVNHGQVFRFLTKPCPADELELAIRAGLRQHQLVMAEKELLEQTLTGAINLVSELLAGVDPLSFTRSQLVRSQGARIARRLGCEDAWEVEVAALLAPIGRITLTAGVLQAAGNRPGAASLLASLPEVGARLLDPIPRMQGVARIIRYQGKGFDGSGLPVDDIQGEAIPLGSRILKVLWDFSELAQTRKSRAVALEELRLRPRAYDPRVLSALGESLASPPPARATATVRVGDLQVGMCLAGEVLTSDGSLVLPTGLHLGPGHLELLSVIAKRMDLQEFIPILLPTEESHET
ncbi:MAG TPA: HD domain-containing phosphohydrolase [Geothrix sp.]|jgi:response regulator RpfG family c-di-GMP phosphodiesterase|nr:HD domain-containing phosphohydrolase [Geothrix sp.]